MHTILGANGIIGEELAKALRADQSTAIRLVGRNPQAIHAEDELIKADLLLLDQVREAVQGTEIAYLTVGLPYRSKVWLRDWPRILANVIAACKEVGCKLVYFDNTYAYPQDAEQQVEDTPLASDGAKGRAKREAAELLLKAMAAGEVTAMICRAPEFYGPGKTKSITNTLIFENLQQGKAPKVLVRDDTLRTLIYTPDASRAMALLANTPDAYGQTWHLPCDDARLTNKGFVEEVSRQLKRHISYGILRPFLLRVVALFNGSIKETLELLPRYEIDNIFDSSKFKARFPDFKVTSYSEGIAATLTSYGIS
ncbi:MAG: NAD-dependent epimerase/dehydratase family protein [Bacteroidota bacterium]